MNTDIIQNKFPDVIRDIKIKQLVGKDIKFWLTEDIEEDFGLIGTLKSYEGDDLIIKLWEDHILVKVYEIYGLREI